MCIYIYAWTGWAFTIKQKLVVMDGYGWSSQKYGVAGLELVESVLSATQFEMNHRKPRWKTKGFSHCNGRMAKSKPSVRNHEDGARSKPYRLTLEPSL